MKSLRKTPAFGFRTLGGCATLGWLVLGCGRFGFEDILQQMAQDVGRAPTDAGGEGATSTAPNLGPRESDAAPRLTDASASGGATPGGFPTPLVGDAGARPGLKDAGNEPEPTDASRLEEPDPASGLPVDAGASPTVDTGQCPRTAPFGPALEVSGLGAGPQFSPALSADGLVLFFASNGEIYSARRAAANDRSFVDLSAVTGVNSAQPELTPGLSADGLTLYFGRDLDGGGLRRNLFQATRSNVNEPFGNVAVLPGINDDFASDIQPRPSSNGLELFFSSNRFGGPGLVDIYRATRGSVGEDFGNAQPVAELSTNEDEAGMTVSADGLDAYFSSGRSGGVGNGDLFTSSRPDLSSAFGASSSLVELNTPDNELDPNLREDGQELLFVSDRSGEPLIYSARRDCSSL